MEKRVADLLFEELVECGVTDCFAVVGGGAMHLDNALALNDNIHKYFNHHEQASAMAAEGYARYSGKPACVCVTSGPGALNTLNGVAGAWEDSIPMIVVSGQVRYAISTEITGLPLRCRGTQEFEILPAARSMTKYSVRLKDPKDVKKVVDEAYYYAMTGRRGPVWIDVPLDVQSMKIETDELNEFICPEDQLIITDDEYKLIMETLDNSSRPCILAGSGIISSHIVNEFTEFLDRFHIPVVGGSYMSDLLPNNHKLYYGLSGNIGPRTGNFILQNADTILVLGNSLSYRQTGFAQEKFAPNARIIMVDADKAEGQKPGIHVEHFVYATLESFFEASKRVEGMVKASDEWIAYCDKVKSLFSPYEGSKNDEPDGRVGQYSFWKIYDDIAPNDEVTVLGNNTAICAKLQTGKRTYEQRIIANYTIGSMGYDIPAAIGAAVAAGREVICVTGDGSIMMNLQELQTIAHYDMPIKIIIFENNGYNAIRQTCKNFFNGKVIGCTPDTGVSFPEFEKVAECFGFDYNECRTNADIEVSLRWIFLHKGKAILIVREKLDDPLIPKVMSKINKDGSFQTPALQDMAPFIDEELLKELMISEM